MDKINKWYTVVEYIDIETGEIITKSLAKREYKILKKTKNIEILETVINHEIKKNGYIKYTAECEKNRQLRLF